VIEPAQAINNASLKEDEAGGCSVVNKVLDIHSRERRRNN
jgi:hypothetical protein